MRQLLPFLIKYVLFYLQTVAIWILEKLKANNSKPDRILTCHGDWINSCCWSNTADFLVSQILQTF